MSAPTTHGTDRDDAAANPWWLEHGRLIGCALVAAGVVMALAAFVGVQRAEYLLNELSYIATGGIAGVFCVGIGAAILIATKLAVSRRRLELLERGAQVPVAIEETEWDERAVVDVTSAERPADPPIGAVRQVEVTAGASATTRRASYR